MPVHLGKEQIKVTAMLYGDHHPPPSIDVGMESET